ncbi:hypothetical protein PAPYR_8424 [Paratrimastix pyriformis]|uniref:DUF4200 domain-containing protein n=1 Tax=Paratrimastix pyriformis TaxID=342808 RepID=A0ABQ8UC75_9EUKA|nr:hypothetical protein PAPYR_8424 [Paratrimastix pyriformis]
MSSRPLPRKPSETSTTPSRRPSSKPLGANPFHMPPGHAAIDMIEEEERKKKEIREKMRVCSIQDKPYTRGRAISNTQLLQTIDPSYTAGSKARGTPTAGGTISPSLPLPTRKPRTEPRESLHEFIDKKREMFMVGISVQTKESEIQRLQALLEQRRAEIESVFAAPDIPDAGHPPPRVIHAPGHIHTPVISTPIHPPTPPKKRKNLNFHQDFAFGFLCDAHTFSLQSPHPGHIHTPHLLALEGKLQDDNKAFDDARDNLERAAEESAMEVEKVQKEREKATAELKRIESGIQRDSVEIEKSKERLGQYLECKRFLEGLMPPEVREQEQMLDEQIKAEVFAGWRPHPPNYEEEKKRMYFKTPVQLMEVFNALEEHNLQLIQDRQDAEEVFETLRQTYERAEAQQRAKLAELESQEAAIQALLERESDRNAEHVGSDQLRQVREGEKQRLDTITADIASVFGGLQIEGDSESSTTATMGDPLVMLNKIEGYVLNLVRILKQMHEDPTSQVADRIKFGITYVVVVAIASSHQRWWWLSPVRWWLSEWWRLGGGGYHYSVLAHQGHGGYHQVLVRSSMNAPRPFGRHEMPRSEKPALRRQVKVADQGVKQEDELQKFIEEDD